MQFQQYRNLTYKKPYIFWKKFFNINDTCDSAINKLNLSFMCHIFVTDKISSVVMIGLVDFLTDLSVVFRNVFGRHPNHPPTPQVCFIMSLFCL